MINPDTLLTLSNEQRGLLAQLSNKQKGLLFSLSEEVLMTMLAMGQAHGMDVVKGMLEVSVLAEAEPRRTFVEACEDLENLSPSLAEQFMNVLELTAAIRADKLAVLEGLPSPIGTWDDVLPLLDRVNWEGVDDLVQTSLINDVSGWLHLTVPEVEGDRDNKLKLLQSYIDKYQEGSLVRAVLQLIKTSQHGMYILGSGAHHGQPEDVVHGFTKEWLALHRATHALKDDLVVALLRERTSRLNSLQKHILGQDVSNADTRAFFLRTTAMHQDASCSPM